MMKGVWRSASFLISSLLLILVLPGCFAPLGTASAISIQAVKDGDVDGSLGNYLRRVSEPLIASYDALPPKGKFATGAVIGFTGARFAVRSVVGAVKILGIAFVASEVVGYTGVLDKIPDEWTETGHEVAETVKLAAASTVKDMRATFRKHFGQQGLRDKMEGIVTKEKMATLGFATGALVGFVI